MAVTTNYSSEYASESPYSVVKIPRQRIPGLWHAISPLLKKGMGAAPELNLDYIVDGLADESIQLWMVLEEVASDTVELQGVFLTSIERDRGEWVISLYALGGHEPKRWLKECDAKMQAFALLEGAARVRMAGRRAWIKLLPESFAITGVKSGHFIYERDVHPSGETRRVKS
jgi:hypothetical protein